MSYSYGPSQRADEFTFRRNGVRIYSSGACTGQVSTDSQMQVKQNRIPLGAEPAREKSAEKVVREMADTQAAEDAVELLANATNATLRFWELNSSQIMVWMSCHFPFSLDRVTFWRLFVGLFFEMLLFT